MKREFSFRVSLNREECSTALEKMESLGFKKMSEFIRFAIESLDTDLAEETLKLQAELDKIAEAVGVPGADPESIAPAVAKITKVRDTYYRLSRRLYSEVQYAPVRRIAWKRIKYFFTRTHTECQAVEDTIKSLTDKPSDF